MNYANIKNYDVADGPGVRVSLFVSGCRHHCRGCFNAETWDFDFGQPYTKETEDEILKFLEPDYIQGFTLLGGEPFEPENQVELVGLLRRIRQSFPKKDIWCYTGYLYDVDLVEGGKVFNRMAKAIGHMEAVKRMVERDEDCGAVLIQLAAVRSAINNTGKVVLKNHINHCIMEAVEENDQEAIALLDQAIDKFM